MTAQISPLSAVPIAKVNLTGGFWSERQATNRNKTIPSIYHQMDITGRLDAWRLDWQPGKLPRPHIFWDSDAGKWIEAVGYSLMTQPSPEFEAQVDAVVELIEKAQQPDGYLNIFFTSVEPQNKWRNLRDWHELYDAGHLIEGAVAYAQATGKRKLLDVLIRYADYIDQTFGPNDGQKRGYCGYPEVELALVKLYQETGKERYLKLSKYFVDERGQQPSYFDQEALERGDDPGKFWAKTYQYCQAHAPVRDQHRATGHSVRAAYLYSGMADLAGLTDDASLLSVCQEIWDDITQHQMYITGGLGPAHTNEGFTFSYDLPNEEAYAETCASIALVLWAHRMFQIDPDSRYIDTMERALYNGFISGVSYEGSTFFYANPLASYPKINPYSGHVIDGHYGRSEWFDCACCPPNLARLIASIGQYFYSTGPDSLYVHLYNANHAELTVAGRTVGIDQHTNYPWDGTINLNVSVDQPTTFTIALRIPGWCRDFQIKLNGSVVKASSNRGYVYLTREWKTGDVVMLDLAMPVERIAAHPQVRQDAGCIALQRGPVVYCLEEVDNGAALANVALPREAALTATFEPALFNGVSVINGQAIRMEPQNWPADLYQPTSALIYEPTVVALKAIPYCFWANRQSGEMRVWIRESG